MSQGFALRGSVKGIRTILSGGLLLFFGCTAVLAQTITASVTGTVTDQSGAVISGARVVAANAATGIIFPTITNDAGVYTIKFLPIGRYTLSISAVGFKKASIGPFDLVGGQDARFDPSLSTGSTDDTVVVTTALPLLDTQDAQLSTSFNEKMIKELPLVANNIYNIGLLVPGSTTYYTQDNVPTTGMPATHTFSINGNREQSNVVILDGAEISDAANNYPGYNANREAVQEFRIITGNGTAEFGNANGGTVVMTTKSGTNNFHGGAFWQLQNTLLNANTFVQKRTAGISGTTPAPRPPQNRNFFGGQLGGPILRDKLFFFGAYKGTRLHVTVPQNITVPDAAYGGVVGQDMTKGYDPQTKTTYAVTNPIAKYLFAHPELYPVCSTLCNRTGTGTLTGTLGYNYQAPATTFTQVDQEDVKIDWRKDEKNLFSGRYSQASNTFSYSKVAIPALVPFTLTFPYQGGVLNWVHTVSPSVVNEARIGFSRTGNTQTPLDISGAWGTSGNAKLGIPGAQNFPGIANILFQGSGGIYPSMFGAVTVNAGNGGISSNGGQAATTVINAFEYGDSLSWQLGRHTIKVGAQAIRYQENIYYSGNFGALGSLTYQTSSSATYGTKSAWGDFLTDQAFTYAQGANSGEWGQREWRTAAFFQDDFKVRPDLTLNLGMRWEFDQPLTEVHNKQANIDPSTGQLRIAGVNGVGNRLVNAFYGGFMPRVGFAYAPDRFHNRLSIRGGYSITNFMEGTGSNLRLTLSPLFVYNASPAAGTVPGYKAGSGFGTGVPGTIAGTAPAWNVHIKPALVQQFDLAAGYEINNSTSAQLAYAGQLGRHLINVLALNQSTCSAIPIPGLSTPCNVPLLNVYPALSASGIRYTDSSAVLSYNALQANLTHHVSHGLEFLVNYTWSRSLTNSTGFWGPNPYPQDSYNVGGDYGPAFYDATHIVSGAGYYQLPIGRQRLIGRNWNRWVDSIVGGWKVSAMLQYHSGFPVTITSTRYYNTAGQGAGTVRANHYRQLKVVDRSSQHWFGTDPSAEGAASLHSTNGIVDGTTGSSGISGRTGSTNVLKPAKSSSNPNQISVNPVASNTVYAETYAANGGKSATYNVFTVNDNGTSAYGEQLTTGFGTASNNSERAPGYEDVSAAASKQFALWEGSTLDFRADAFNVLNFTSLGAPNSSISATNFGQITSANNVERHLQLALKLTF